LSELELRPWVNPNNYDILNAVRNESSGTYQDRIPNADKANIDDVIHNLLSWTPGMNEFIYSLVNVIGLQIYRNVNTFNNPLAKFKRGMLMTGDTIEEIMNGLLEAHRYNPNAEYLEEDIFGVERPEVQVNYHSIDRKDYYKLSINRVELRKAFMSENGLDQFITNLMSTPQTSDQWDEFLATASLLKTWHDYGGFFNVNIPDVSANGSTQADSQYALRRLRELGDTLPFLSRRYNPAHLPMAANREDLELIITPEANAAIDVEALAGAFNIDKAEFASRKTIIPAEYIGIDGFQAMLTTREFFVIADSLLETQSVNNPVGLVTNFFLHHQEVISASRFAPAILFTSTEESTPIVINDTPVVSIAAPTLTDVGGDTVTDVIRGDSYQIHADALTDPAGGANDAVRLVLVGAQSTRTRVWQTGFFTVALDEAATQLTINTVAVDDGTITSTATFDVVGDLVGFWPFPGVKLDTDDDGLFEVTPEFPVIDESTYGDDGYYHVTIPAQEGIDWKFERLIIPLTASGNKVQIDDHGLSVNDIVTLGAITTTTGISAATPYYVKTIVDANNVTLSATPGGSTIVLTGNGQAASATYAVANGDVENVANAHNATLIATAASGYEITVGADTTLDIVVPSL